MESKSNTDILKGYFVRKQGSLDTMTCRVCKKDIKAPKGKIKMLIVELGMGGVKLTCCVKAAPHN